jgi:hypothetical protein
MEDKVLPFGVVEQFEDFLLDHHNIH